MTLRVAIDGPAGSGKSTLARGLARELGLPYVNTGLMYRALTRRALDLGIDLRDAPALTALARSMEVDLDHASSPPEIAIDGSRPGPELATPEVEANVSVVASHQEVREVMVERQRDLGHDGAVMEGRDIGRVVMPDATVKIFLDARPDERAGRRTEERGASRSLAEALARRDEMDARTNPFVPAPDAVRLDTSDKTVEEALAEALAIVRREAGEAP
ncbi:MAG TPA: (d)CMP kinase [Actinomycetota bacterium]